MSIRLVKGYPKVTFKVNGIPKDYYVHRLEMEAFNPVENMENLDVNNEVIENNELFQNGKSKSEDIRKAADIIMGEIKRMWEEENCR